MGIPALPGTDTILSPYTCNQKTRSLLIYHCEYFIMAGQEEKDGIIRLIRDAVSSLPQLRLAYVYGSFLSRNDFRDIDIALLVNNRLQEENALKFAAKAGDTIEKTLGFRYEVDVRILNHQPVWFQFKVISTGIPVYAQHEDARVEFETWVLVEYMDIKSMYDLFDREYLAKA